MTSASEPGSSIVQQQQQQRSRRSRFANPFSSFISSKPNHISDYSIELDEPLRRYGPGDTIKGTIVLDVARPLGITHIVVALFGYLEVFKNHSRNKTGVRDSAARVASGKGKRWVSEYYGDGFASLFEDEVVLCGEGRLDPKSYHFRFELDFPKNLKIPSSIDFERGTVTYAISATITRPTTMNPSTTCNRKVYYREMIDVALLPPTKPRVVTLEPVTSGSRTKMVRRFTSHSQRDEQRSVSQASARSRADGSPRPVVDASSSVAESRASSPVQPSAASSTSVPSTAARESALLSEPGSSHTSPSPKTTHGTDSPSRIIKASVQLDRAGCLPGDVVPVTVSVNHTKAIKSVKGVIATLFRQARVDMHPNLPLAPTTDGKKTPKYEDYYPRSKTGLGGLSLSAAGSSQVWRKDLSQTSAPLYVNPSTMSAVIKLNLRVPDDVFPTMRSAPGDMITFRYYVEVVVDINGKMASHTAVVNPELSSPQPHLNTFEQSRLEIEQAETSFPTWGQGCFDTTSIRRDRSAITCNCELVIGSKNSNVAQGKRRQQQQASWDDGARERAFSGGSDVRDYQHGHHRAYPRGERQEGHRQEPDYYHYDPAYHDHYDHGHSQERYLPNNDWNQADPYYDPGYARDNGDTTPQQQRDHYTPIPPPVMEDESALPEKERLRRAEARLLPSSPPVAEGAPNDMPGPSAPYLPDENDFESPQAFRDAVQSLSSRPPDLHASAVNAQGSQRSTSILRDDLAVSPSSAQAAPMYESPPESHSMEQSAGAAAEPPPSQTLTDGEEYPQRDRRHPSPSAPPAATFDDNEPRSITRTNTAINTSEQGPSRTLSDPNVGKDGTAADEATTIGLQEDEADTAPKENDPKEQS